MIERAPQADLFRQIKNTMSITCTMAGKDDAPEFGHVRSASTVNGHCGSEPGLVKLRDELYE
ncbi:hypothetical protein I7I53_03054 [Histoplasma capsulatum var. duboisii H88]|uniref:Uncharacterized protein n=1 Tax=Ajellomyces capsulatus (strain H88) TaxID=544711 RepID=A0A8A1LMP9_AJEC8|nr:hypothetical protein I7I53_03054 [Histoplasma capsulatum var. duboisii H88]